MDNQGKASLERFRREEQRRVAHWVPTALMVLAACAVCATILEIWRFPDRRGAVLVLDGTFALITLAVLGLMRAIPNASVWIVSAAVNLLGLTLNAYHASVSAQIAGCLWTITGLLCAAALFFGWGWRTQLLSSLGSLFGYLLFLGRSGFDMPAWTAGAVYLAWVFGLSVLGAEFIQRYLRRQFELVSVLMERESRLQSYFDLSLVGTAILSRQRLVLEVNEELCRILGCRQDELLHSPWSEVVPLADRDRDSDLFRDVLDGGVPAACHEAGLLRRDGQSIHASISVRALPGPLGSADHLIVVVQDLTERRRADREREQALTREQAARREAEAASRAKDEFLAVVSHELRTPLTAIFGWVPLLRGGQLNSEEQSRALDTIERSSRSLVQVIDDLLDVSRIVSGKLRLAVRPTAVTPVVQAAAESMRPAATAKGVDLKLHCPDTGPFVLGDPDRLQQIVWNLIANAIKFTDANGRVDVDVLRESNQVVVQVRDSGRGISPQLLPLVFERFWQADSSTTRRHGGLGLGLAIVRHLVELHGGTVSVDSPGPGQGSVFRVQIPELTNLPMETAPSRASAHGPRALAGVRVLVVDDEVDSQEVARRTLELSGGEVRTAGNTEQALQILEGWAPTVLISDIAMPDEDGFALIQRVRTREAKHGGHVPALAYTALARSDDRSRVLAAGFDGYLAKPMDPSELVDAVVAAAGVATA